MSFLTIGVIWLNHHRVFEQVARVDGPLLLLNLNLLLLMSISFGGLFAWVTHTDRLLHRPPPPGMVRGARRRFVVGQVVYAAALALSWVSAPLAVALCGLMALYYAFDQASVPAAEPSDHQPTRGSAQGRP